MIGGAGLELPGRLTPIVVYLRPDAVFWGYLGVAAALVAGSFAAWLVPRLDPAGGFGELAPRMRSWWVMAILVGGALLLGWQASALVFILVSFLALREFLSLAPARIEDRPIIVFAYLTIPVSYVFVFLHIYMFYLVFVPVWVFLATPFLMAIIGQTRGYLTSAAVFHWGTVTCVYNIGFIPLLMLVPKWDAPQAGAAGLVFLLLVATEANDVFQYICGKLFGRHKILPKVSPNKTWEGFLGGWALTALLLLMLGPIYTPLRGVGLWTVALVLPIAGFAGDVTFSAIKRDIGVKDTSHFIPGHGGVLDRIDSLTFTTPLYFHLLAYFSLKTY
jgi:phosphatidate cytidylyltransferase